MCDAVQPEANIIKLAVPNISASVPQLKAVFMDTRRETNTYANLGTEGGQTLNRP